MKAIVYLVVASFIGSSFSNTLCPFPGIPKNGFGHLAENRSEELSWDKKQLFNVGDVISFDCFNGWKVPMHHDTITCRSDGTWSGIAPKCEKAVHGSNWETEFFIIRSGTLISKISDSFECDDLLQYTKFHLQPKNTQLNPKFISDIRVELCQGSTGIIGMNIKTQLSQNMQPCNLILERPLVRMFRCPSSESGDNQDTLELVEIEVLEQPIHLKDFVISITSDDHCGLPVFPVNGNTSEAISANEYKYTCNEGFHLVGEETAACTPTTGQWSSAPLCVPISPSYTYTITAAIVAILIAIIAIIICVITLNRKRCCRNRAAKVPWDPNSMDSPTASAYAPEVVITQNYPDEGHYDEHLPDDSSIAEQVEYENEQREYDDLDDRVSSD